MFDLIVIGWGKGGKTLANILANKGKKVAIIEKDPKMYGGTCPNVGCLPTKAMIHRSKILVEIGALGVERDYEFNNVIYQNALTEKKKLVNKVNSANYNLLNNNENIKVYKGEARFISNTEVLVNGDVLKAKNIVINTGSKTRIPEIEGINSDKVLTSDTALELEVLPERLGIIGGGFIGLEFASYFNNFGSEVTVFEGGNKFMPREDEDISECIYNLLTEQGINFNFSSKILEIKELANKLQLKYEKDGETKIEYFENILVSIGREPNTDGLGLENTDIKVSDRGEILVDEYLETIVSGIFAVGDVKGGEMFTAVSLDDSRIVLSKILNEKGRSLKEGRNVPKVLFIDPSYAQVGLNELKANELGIKYTVKKLPTTTIPKSLAIGETGGFTKVLINENDEIIGAFIINYEAHEMINLLALAIDQKIKYQVLRDLIYAHPIYTEGLNDVLK
ncbi:NAD(P)/FAD-dependent oxidoreductase [Streptobacillus felis]|uniref:NAD(P)/FAD-dependent oxidoreductase n=1 Tax=Streptobacillus felis TaxID=1384509 RepID=A0A7Z0T702_9FUSO|nr:NAD(P)/FAD-dependent oxidoreductase [Streptobacillus felis]NYV27771.1 NAD(P)/FAD-dependent oxidoreductase [Streptobacillus felis]